MMSKTIEQLSEIFEGSKFRFSVNIAPGYKMFKRLVQQREAFEALVQFAAAGSGAREVSQRIKYLLALDTNPQYENPHDAAVASYLLALNLASRAEARTAANAIMDKPKLWWAYKVAEGILIENL